MTVFVLTHTVVNEWHDALYGVYATRQLAEEALLRETKLRGLKVKTEKQKEQCYWSGEWFDVREEYVMGT